MMGQKVIISERLIKMKTEDPELYEAIVHKITEAVPHTRIRQWGKSRRVEAFHAYHKAVDKEDKYIAVGAMEVLDEMFAKFFGGDYA